MEIRKGRSVWMTRVAKSYQCRTPATRRYERMIWANYTWPKIISADLGRAAYTNSAGKPKPEGHVDAKPKGPAPAKFDGKYLHYVYKVQFMAESNQTAVNQQIYWLLRQDTRTHPIGEIKTRARSPGTADPKEGDL